MSNWWLNTSKFRCANVRHSVLISDLLAIHRCYCNRSNFGRIRIFTEIRVSRRASVVQIVQMIRTNLKLKWASFVTLWPSFFHTMRRCNPMTSLPLCRDLSGTSISFSPTECVACGCGDVAAECEWCGGELCCCWYWSNIFGSGATPVLLFLMNAVATWHVRSMVLPIL